MESTICSDYEMVSTFCLLLIKFKLYDISRDLIAQEAQLFFCFFFFFVHRNLHYGIIMFIILVYYSVMYKHYNANNIHQRFDIDLCCIKK